MGKRSRKQRPVGGTVRKSRPEQKPTREPEPPQGLLGRAKASWQLAGSPKSAPISDARHGVRPTAPWREDPAARPRGGAKDRGQRRSTDRNLSYKERRKLERAEREAARPPALWGSFPVSELLIFLGAIVLVVGFAAGVPALIFAGIGAVAVASLEVAAREHVAGFKAHSLILALAPTAVLHIAVSVAVDSSADSPLLFVADVFVFGASASTFAQLYKRWSAESASH